MSKDEMNKCLPILAEQVNFDILTPVLVDKGVISERRKGEYSNSQQTNEEKFNLLLLDLYEQGVESQQRFLHSLYKTGFGNVAVIVQSHFGVELIDSPNSSSPSIVPSSKIAADGCSWSAISIQNESSYEINLDEIVVTQGKKFYSPSKTSNIYRMSSRPKGYALIIVNQNFDDHLYTTRIGAERDRINLIGLFKGLGYEIFEHFNKTTMEMRSIIRKFSQLPEHKLVDSTVVAISSHGETNRVVGIDNEYLWMEDILDNFNNENCPQLINKPKMFFVQACRGKKFDGGVLKRNHADGGAQGGNNKLLQPVTRSPTWTDMVIAYSTVPEYVALRNEIKGSWFVQAVTKVFCQHAWNTNLYKLFQKVTELMENFETYEGEKQTPEFAHRGWKRDLYFNPGLYQP